MKYADVIVDITHVDVDKIFEYSFSDCRYNIGNRVLVPFGNKTIEGIIINVKDESVFSPDKIKPIIKLLEETPVLTKETVLLADYIKSNCYVTNALALRLFLPSEMRKGRVKEKFEDYVTFNKDCNLDEFIASLQKRSAKQKDLAIFLADEGKIKVSEANKQFGTSAVKSLIEKNIAIKTTEKSVRSPYKELVLREKEIVLTAEQKNAISSIENSQKPVTLLFGVTGSGKTEIYLNLIDNAIKSGKTAIMLVPEISLTPQMLSQLRARFGEKAAILHSGLSAGERFDEWWRLRNGEAKIAIGARSAIFAPLENIGVIIIDEEHDGSYVSESSPRYNTIDVAKFRANYNGAKIVLGSATPSVESFLSAKNGEYNLTELKERINKKPLPKVEIVDMRNEVKRGNNSPFSSILKAELEDCLNNGNQAILFLNQRGYSKSVICAECGNVLKCDSCDVSLTYHKEEESLLCHYCGAKYKMVSACPKCGSKFLRYGGTGTERIVSELRKLYPKAKILRMDRDTTQTKEGHFDILNKFSSKEADILVGTQMVAKGHDFPSVTLVGILDADMSLHFSDFRSGERTFQLITQVSGRSGRAKESGKVVLQTYSPENSILKYAVKYDYIGFFNNEIEVRKATAFPPFSDIVRVLISGINDDETVDATKSVYFSLKEIYDNNKEKFRFFGCMKAPLKKLKNTYRYQVLMRLNSGDKELLDKIYFASVKYRTRTIDVVLEVNPSNLN